MTDLATVEFPPRAIAPTRRRPRLLELAELYVLCAIVLAAMVQADIPRHNRSVPWQ